MSIMYAKSISTINIMYNAMFKIFLQQLSKAIALFYFKNVFKFLTSVSMKVFISIKTTSPHEGSLRAEIELEILLHNIFVCLVETLRTTRAPRRNMHLVIFFFRNDELPEMSLRNLQNASVYYPSGKYKLLIRSCLEYCYTIIFVHNIVPLKRMSCAWYKCAQNFFIPEFDTNFYQVFHL